METPRLDSGVYLAGAITGLTYEQSVGWRQRAAETLDSMGYSVYSPMRAKLHLATPYATKPIPHTSDLFRDPFQRDRLDLQRSDFVLVNLEEAPIGPSVGTIWELGYACGRGLFIVGFHPDPAFAPHPFIANSINALVHSLDDALALLAEFRPL